MSPSTTGSPNAGASRYALRASDDVDQHATHISAWQQEYDQLSPGCFAGTVRELWIDELGLQVFHERTGPRTGQRCAPWRGAVWFGIPDGPGADPLHFCGHRQATDRDRMLLSACADQDFVLRTPRDFGIYGVVIDEIRLEELLLLACDGTAPPAVRAGTRGIATRATPMSGRSHAALCATIESLLRLGAGEGDGPRQPGAEAALRCAVWRLVSLIGDALRGGGGDGRAGEGLARMPRRLAMVMAARDLAIDPCQGPVSVEALCARFHLTPRTLHNHFKTVVGESPVDFLRTVRLNACRRRLRGAARGDKVQDVAAQWGFFHMGHFSEAYHSLFGELPSQTLRRASSLH